MYRESQEINDPVDTSLETDNTAVIQVGSQQVTDATGAFGRAEQKVAGLSEQGANGDVSATLSGNKLTRRLEAELAEGKTKIVLDLTRADDIGPDDIQELIRRRDSLKLRGVTLTLTGLTAQEELNLKTSGAVTNGMETFTKVRSDDAFKSEEKLAA